jgi:hypothetical protein
MDEIVLSNKNELTTDVCNSMDLKKHYTEWKKLGISVYKLYDSIHIKLKVRTLYYNIKQTNDCLGLGA